MRLFLFGTGGHARKVYHYVLACGHAVAGFVDEDAEARSPIPGARLLAKAALPRPASGEGAFVAIGNAAVRKRLLDELGALGWMSPALVHPSAVVAPDASLEAGALVAAGAIVETGSVVGRGAIVDIGARIDHDCRIGAFSHIGPGATLPPRTRTEDGQHVG